VHDSVNAFFLVPFSSVFPLSVFANPSFSLSIFPSLPGAWYTDKRTFARDSDESGMGGGRWSLRALEGEWCLWHERERNGEGEREVGR